MMYNPFIHLNNYAAPIIFSEPSSPIFTPKKHTVEIYRSQQRKAGKRCAKKRK